MTTYDANALASKSRVERAAPYRHEYYNRDHYPVFLLNNGNWDICADANGRCASIPTESAALNGCMATHFGDLRYVQVTLGFDRATAEKLIQDHLATAAHYAITGQSLKAGLQKPVRTLTCACCGKPTKGRQWPGRDAGFGLCTPCIPFASRGVSADDMRQCYGVAGQHYGLTESAQ